ncbi:MAG: hypothetical protein AMJ62_13235 [Myxococcales bacterium SG8_38]|nr:MAG: hypothetical protein AMJ62_13235 [Myxococcales bacterium SG8_38]
MTRWLAWILLALLAASCRRGGTNVVLASLDRSAKIQLLCADLELVTGNLYEFEQVFPLDLCDPDTSFAPDIEPQLVGAVTQAQTGTVAAISFTSSAILDTNRTIPGVTSFIVGEQPTGIQISPAEPSYTYVSSYTPKSVQAVPSEAIIDGDSELPIQQVRFDEGPTDLALHELAIATRTTDAEGRVTGATSEILYRFLYAAVPELGQVFQIPVETVATPDGDRHASLGAPQPLLLDGYDCSSVTPVPPPESTSDDYNRICPQSFQDIEGRFVKTVQTTVTCVDGSDSGPSPVALAVDLGSDPTSDEDDVLLVADANQPVIHRFKLDASGATPLDPIVSGTPTIDLAVTPLVPASSDPQDRAATQRYLYAVSATDSSVLAIEYIEDSPTFGAVLPVIAGVSPRANEENVESRNRVRAGFSNVRSIEVISPFYEVDSSAGTASVPADDICDPNDDEAFALAQNLRNLRGVFLAVSLSNGTMYFLDVYDLNAPCRGGQGAIACTPAETGPDQFASIRRHRRRFGFTPSTFISIDGTPSLQFNTVPGQLEETTGNAAGSDGPGLEFIDCPASMGSVFGIPPNGQTDGLICSSSQVWSTFNQRWDARWQGLIPNSQGGLGRFSDESFQGQAGTWFLAGDVPFCRVGVLGRQPGPAADTGLSIDRLPAYGGDRLLITGELPFDRREDPRCEQFVDLRDEIDDFPVWFPIINAYDDQLEIGPSPNPNRYTLEEVRYCFDEYTEYQIHTRGVYTVTGTTSGFIHRVVPDSAQNDKCVFDEPGIDDDPRPIDPDDVDTYLTGRAFEDTQFINPLVSFRIGPFNPQVALTDTTVALLNFNILNQFRFEVLDTGGAGLSLPSSMLFSSAQDQLFFVDFEAGVRLIVFSPLSIVQTFQ